MLWSATISRITALAAIVSSRRAIATLCLRAAFLHTLRSRTLVARAAIVLLSSGRFTTFLISILIFHLVYLLFEFPAGLTPLIPIFWVTLRAWQNSVSTVIASLSLSHFRLDGLGLGRSPFLNGFRSSVPILSRFGTGGSVALLFGLNRVRSLLSWFRSFRLLRALLGWFRVGLPTLLAIVLDGHLLKSSGNGSPWFGFVPSFRSDGRYVVIYGPEDWGRSLFKDWRGSGSNLWNWDR